MNICNISMIYKLHIFYDTMYYSVPSDMEFKGAEMGGYHLQDKS